MCVRLREYIRGEANDQNYAPATERIDIKIDRRKEIVSHHSKNLVRIYLDQSSHKPVNLLIVPLNSYERTNTIFKELHSNQYINADMALRQEKNLRPLLLRK